MIVTEKSEEVVRLLPERHVLPIRVYGKIQKNDNKLVKQFICDQQMFSFQEEKATNFFLFFYSTIKVFPFNEKCTSLLFSNTFSNSGNSP